jgi:hypothetical protein
MKFCLCLLVCNDIFPLLMVMKITNGSSTLRFKFCVDFFFLVQNSDAAFGGSDVVALI